jgi:hypothetical protein
MQAAEATARLAAAHRALRADPDIQFQLQPAEMPKPPEWLLALSRWLGHALRPVGRFFKWIGSFMPDAPWARILLWTVLALAAAALLAALWIRLRDGSWRWPFRRRARPAEAAPEEESWAPEAGEARAWLSDADALAAEGRYAEAVHHLLLRSVDDIARRRPRLVRPALTSRELAAATAVPTGARALFARIAGLVERSLFGGRPVSAEDWTAARGDYADFVLPKAWKA